MEQEASTIEADVRCQARPAAARPGYRADMLCASRANTSVLYDGVEMPVCRIHASTYASWGDEGEVNAEVRWRWRPACHERAPTAVCGEAVD